MKNDCGAFDGDGYNCINCLGSRVGALLLTSRRNFVIIVRRVERQGTEIVWYDNTNRVVDLLSVAHAEFFATELVK